MRPTVLSPMLLLPLCLKLIKATAQPVPILRMLSIQVCIPTVTYPPSCPPAHPTFYTLTGATGDIVADLKNFLSSVDIGESDIGILIEKHGNGEIKSNSVEMVFTHSHSYSSPLPSKRSVLHWQPAYPTSPSPSPSSSPPSSPLLFLLLCSMN